MEDRGREMRRGLSTGAEEHSLSCLAIHSWKCQTHFVSETTTMAGSSTTITCPLAYTPPRMSALVSFDLYGMRPRLDKGGAKVDQKL